MINTLHIKNVGIIDDLMIDLNEGFNVLTGETGAGKTLIIDSLGVIAGERFSKEIIRYGENYSLIEASIYLPNRGYEEDTVVISREINLKGKNTCKINGRLVTVNELKEFMKNVIDIHSQNSNHSLLNVSTHIELLDKYIGKDIFTLKKEYLKKYKEYLKIKDELDKNYGDDREKQRKLDILNYQKNENEANIIVDIPKTTVLVLPIKGENHNVIVDGKSQLCFVKGNFLEIWIYEGTHNIKSIY